MSHLPLLRRTVRSERRPLLGWLIGITLLSVVTIGSWPAVEGSTEDFAQVLDNLPDALTAFFGEGIADFSAAGVVGSRLFGSVGLAIFIGYAVSRGARAIAGEEQQGTLELLVTQPRTRTAIAVERVIGMLGLLALLVVVQMVILLVTGPPAGLEFGTAEVVQASAGLFLLAGMFGSLAFTVGAMTGARGLAVAVSAGLALGLFLLTGLGGLVDGLATAAELSPFTRYDGTLALAEGVEAGILVVFALISVAVIAIGVVAFQRRDLS
ncbi:ABC transporter permease subunit [Euzebya tangerina]|uniref:ABC transporter permease subunit n=1 Tax=Euzebya tangerina TaxID=591198 RepID=UPI000E30D086|nr:ABC transporter permease subunit [Euzebya tangerina]